MHVSLARVSATVLSALSLAAALAAQGASSPEAFLRRTFPDFTRANVASAVAAARQAGMLRTPAEYLAFKRAFHALREEKGVAGAALPLLRDFPPAVVTRGVADLLVAESEFNDGKEFATPVGAANIASGDCSAANDVDVFTFATGGEFVTAEVMATGSVPIADSMLGIKSMSGHLIAFSEDISATNFLSRTSVYLPAGIYQMEVAGWNSTNGGSYDVAIVHDPVVPTPLALGPNTGTTVVPGTGSQTVWQLAVPTDSTVDLRVTAGSTSDLMLIVQLADGRMYFENDDSFRGQLDPGADIDLPAGNYTVHVSDLAGGAVPYTLDFGITTTVLPDLCSGQPVNGVVIGPETRRLYRLLSPGGQIDLVTTAGTPLAINDTILYVFDQDLDYLVDVDDANAANPNDFYSRLRMTLPAGVFWVGARGWNTSSGDYVLTPACGQPPTAAGTISYGRSPVPCLGNGQVARSALDVTSENSVRADSLGGVAEASLFNFMDAAGNSLGLIEWSGNAQRLGPGGRYRSRQTTGFLPIGTHYALTWNRFEQPSASMLLDVLPPCNCEGGFLRTHGKAGDFAFLFADFTAGPGVSFAPFGVSGMFLLPFPSPTLVTVGVGAYPPTGVLTWFACPATPFGAYVQHGDVFAVPGTFLGSWRDRRRV